MKASISIYILAVLVSSISQIILKKSTRKKYNTLISEYVNHYVICSYIMFFCATLLTIYALRVLPLTMGTILESTGYLFVTILSRIFLQEKITSRRLLGNLFIISGVIIYGLSV